MRIQLASAGVVVLMVTVMAQSQSTPTLKLVGDRFKPLTYEQLTPAQKVMADHLLAVPTISDRAWTSQPRLLREARSDFVRRVLLGETPAS